jgi:hypothetical protein
VLHCQECKRTTADFQEGWCAFYAQLPEEDDQPVLVTYCSECAGREFGSILHWLTAPAPEPAL